MAIRNTSELIASFLDYYRKVLPDGDTKPGTNLRNIFIEAPSVQIANLYTELAKISNKQSWEDISGTDLERLARNFGITRQQAEGSTGLAILTFASLNGPIVIPSGGIIYANNGVGFSVANQLIISPSNASIYKANATKWRNDLDYVGIKDQYAVAVLVNSTTPGSNSNIVKYSLTRTNIAGISNVTNISVFSGGKNQETDAAFRQRVQSLLSSNATGTALGYFNVLMSIDGVTDAMIIEAGDTLMTRDGTIVETNPDGTQKIVSEGTGGLVDTIILGTSLAQSLDTYIYKDKSNRSDPSDSSNDVVLGQIPEDANKTVRMKRRDNIKNGTLPTQPVREIIEVSGSESGANYLPKSVDSYGRITGNYELIKDTGAYAGSCWGFDKIHFISDKISMFQEDKTKGQQYGQDALIYTNTLRIPKLKQSIAIANENSIVTSDPSVIQLLHTPVITATRVFNTNTGELYVITQQNIDATTGLNSTGKIKISGNTLPATTDILQVDYIWQFDYDQYMDFDGKEFTRNQRKVSDSIDWGYSALIRDEAVDFTLDTDGKVFVGSTTHNISGVISVISANNLFGTVEAGTDIYSNRMVVKFNNLPVEPTSVYSITLRNTSRDLLNTNLSDYIFNMAKTGLTYRLTLILPSDVPPEVVVGSIVDVSINQVNVFATSNNPGDYTLNTITIPSANLSGQTGTVKLFVNYIANSDIVFNSGLNNLNSYRRGNTYKKSSGQFIASNINLSTLDYKEKNIIQSVINRDVWTISQDDYGVFFLETNLPVASFSLTASDIIAVVKTSDSVVLWDRYNQGTITVNSKTNTYQIYFTQTNLVVGQECIVLYTIRDTKNIQPLTFKPEYIQTQLQQVLLQNSASKIFVNEGSALNPILDITLENKSLSTLDPAKYVKVNGYLTYNPIEKLPTFHYVSGTPLTAVSDIFTRVVDTTTGHIHTPVSVQNAGTHFTPIPDGVYDATDPATYKTIGFVNALAINEGTAEEPLQNVKFVDASLPANDPNKIIVISCYITFSSTDPNPRFQFVGSEANGITNFSKIPNLFNRVVDTSAAYIDHPINSANQGRFSVVSFDPAQSTILKFTVPGTYGKYLPLISFRTQGTLLSPVVNVALIDNMAQDTVNDPKKVVIGVTIDASIPNAPAFTFVNCSSDPAITSLALIPNLSRRFVDTTSAYIAPSTVVATQNKGVFTIKSIGVTTFSVGVLNTMTHSQAYVVKTHDNQEAWSYSGTIDIANNKLDLTNIVGVYPGDYVYTIIMNAKELRKSSTKLALTVSDQLQNTGTVKVSGTTLIKATDIVFAFDTTSQITTSKGYLVDLSSAMRQALGLTSVDTIPSNYGIAKIAKLELVNVFSGTNEVLSVAQTLSTKDSYLRQPSFFLDESIEDRSLKNYQAIIPLSNKLTSLTSGKTSQKLRVTMYIYNISDTETLAFTKNGTVYTNKNFLLVDSIVSSSGFNKSQSSKLTIASMNQPKTNERYQAYYDYKAPKQNERMVIKYTYNQLVTESQFAIEKKRPINADVLTKESERLLVDTQMYIVVTKDQTNASATVAQNVRDALITWLTINKLGQIVDASDAITTAQTVQGVDRVRLTKFNISSKRGVAQSIQSKSNQYFAPNTIEVIVETR
jgi:hypothetical protein